MKLSVNVVLLCLVLLIGCGKPVAHNSILPDSNIEQSAAVNWDSSAFPFVAGIWEFHISDTGEVSYVPMRHASCAFNIVRLIDAPPMDMKIQIVDIENLGDHTNLSLNVSITHPIPGNTSLTTFDLRGIIMGTGDITHPYDNSVIYSDNLKILNADGYTRWMNCPEFSGLTAPVLGYTPGDYGTPGFEPTATLNPYKYFTDGLGPFDNAHDFLVANPADRGVFDSTSTNSRNYMMQYSHQPGLKFQYAILSHWAPNIHAPDPPVLIPDDFPEDANASEAVVINVANDTSTMYFDPDEVIGGGNFIADLSIVNWHTQPVAGSIMEDYTIYVYSNAWTGSFSPDMECTDYGDNWAMFHLDVPAEPIAAGPMDIWISIGRTGETYANPYGVITNADNEPLCAHFLHTVDVPIGEVPTGWEPPVGRDPRFCFIHHSVGSGFLNAGGMRDLLIAAGFEVHDRTYGDGWVGDNTNPNHWPTTFTTYYDDMITWELDDGEFYDIVAFKSCYPASAIGTDTELEQDKGYYNAVKAVCEAHPETLFVPYSFPPLVPANTDEDDAARSRIFANWLISPYDDETGNIEAYDVFDILAGDDPGSGDFNMLRYEYQGSATDSHPNAAGSTAVAEDFTAWLVSVVWD